MHGIHCNVSKVTNRYLAQMVEQRIAMLSQKAKELVGLRQTVTKELPCSSLMPGLGGGSFQYIPQCYLKGY